MGSIPSWGTEIPQAAGEANLKKKEKRQFSKERRVNTITETELMNRCSFV